MTKAKVLFVYPNEREMSVIPPAIALLSQLLKDKGHDTDVFDTTFYKFDDEISIGNTDNSVQKSLQARPLLNVDDDNLHFKKHSIDPAIDLRKKIQEYKPNLLAVSCSETTFMRGLRLISSTKDLGVKNIFGGVFPTFAPDLVMKHKDVDMLCVGEGENALVDLVELICEGKDYSNVTNLWVRQINGEIKKNPITKPVDINKLPAVTDIGIFEEKRFYRPMAGKILKMLPVETHRGCPYTCSFCNSPGQNELYSMSGKFFRKKSMKLIKEEIENHIKEWKVEYIFFWADTFLAWSNKEFDEFIEMYKDIKLPFWCQTRIETITRDKFTRLKDVGLSRITFGMEHGNEKFRREVVNRNYSNKLAIELMQIPAELDIPFSVNNIIGFPGETRELAFDTIELNRHFKSDDTSCSILVPFHGTKIRKVAEEKGYIEKDSIFTISYNSDDTVLDMPQWHKEDIINLRNTFAMYIKFPKNRWPEIKIAETNKEIFKKLSDEFVETYWSDRDQDLKEAAKGLI